MQWRPDRWSAAFGAIVVLVTASCSTESSTEPATSTVDVTSSVASSVTTTITMATTTTTASSTARIAETLAAADLARELTEAESAAARGDGSAGRRQQLLYRYLSAHAELDDAVLAGVTDEVRPSVERIIHARQFAQARQAANPGSAPPSATLPAWTVVEPLPAAELLDEYRAAEVATGIAWYWLAAIHLQETRMGRIIGTSSAGAVGPMQFLPSTWARCCTGDPTIPRQAILGAGAYLAQSGGPADMQAALHEYNPSDTYVATVTAFAENMRDNPNLYAAYHEWQVFYSSAAGTIRLPIGYSQAHPIDAAAYLADHPQDAG